MIFSGELFQKVLDGTKTQTRRKYDQTRPDQYYSGQRVAIQAKRGVKGVGFVTLQGVSLVRLDQITEEDAKAEGFDSVSAFIEKWLSLYGVWQPYRVVWKLEFELEKGEI